MYERAKYLPAGDKGLVVEFGNSISKDVNHRVRSFALALDNAGIPGIMEYVPSYRSLLIIYDPLEWGMDLLVTRLKQLEDKLPLMRFSNPKIYHLPVFYGGDKGPDLNFICQYTGLDEEDIIKIHTGVNYLIYMIGFTPGFPYLGGMDERIAAPRLDNPRSRIPAGSVGIAGSQTGIYPMESPGGWRLIGRTPVKLFNPENREPVLLNAGDYVRFFPVSRCEYQEISEKVEKGEYNIKVSECTAGEE
jgi:KipI family sensor histidine kinase inhibitor